MMIRILLIALPFICSSCYRMPTDDDYCLIPVTNNPSVTSAKGNSAIPSASY